MAEILVLAEHSDESVKKVTTELLTLARRFGEPSVVWVGQGAEEAQPRLAEFGAATVYVAGDAEFDDYVVAPKAELLAALVAEKSPAAVLVASTAEGREIAGRLAVKTGSGVLTGAVAGRGTARERDRRRQRRSEERQDPRARGAGARRAAGAHRGVDRGLRRPRGGQRGELRADREAGRLAGRRRRGVPRGHRRGLVL